MESIKKMLIITNSTPIQPRIKKISKIIEKIGFELIYLVWDCEDNPSKELDNNIIYNSSKIGYGHPIKKGFDAIKMIAKAKRIISERKIDYVYAFNIDSAIVMLFSVFKNRNIFMIYDAADLPIMGSQFIDVGLKLFDKIVSQKANLILLGSRYFSKYYEKYEEKTLVIENRIMKKNSRYITANNVGDRLNISFIGIVRYKEILMNLFEATNKLPVSICIYGGGKDKFFLEKFCKDNCYNHVKFSGWYNNENLEEIYTKSNIIWSVYPAKGLNERLAISNKYFEAIYYERPCVFDIRSKVGELAVQNGVGFIVDGYDVGKIEVFVNCLLEKPDILENMKKNFSNCVEYFEDYYKLIRDKLVIKEK